MFLPDEPITEGHVLVVPNDHVPDIWSLTQGAARNLSSEVLRMAHIVRSAIEPDGLNIIQSNGKAATQSVHHLHVHVVPRSDNDAMGDFWPQSPDWTDADLAATRDMLEHAVAVRPAPLGYDLNNDQDREDRRKHVDLLATVINRMASSSVAAKGWSIALAGAAYGVALARDNWPLILLGIVVLAMFAVLDSRYVDNERRARRLHADVAERNSVLPLSMADLTTPARDKQKGLVERVSNWVRRVLQSWSVWLFYGPLIGAGAVLLLVAIFLRPPG